MRKTIGLLALSLLVYACNNTPNTAGTKPKVVATTGMLYDAVINIAGDKVDAQPIMGSGVDPHLYKATQGDLRKLQSADLIIYNGLLLEGKMAEILEKQARIKSVVAAAEAIDKSQLLGSELYENAYDPHVWFDVKLWQIAVNAVAEGLIKLDAENAALYRENTRRYVNTLDSLHMAVGKKLQEIPATQKILITAHDAFGYFGRAYDLEVKGLQGISTLSDFGLRDIADLIDLIIERNIKAIFVETSVSPQAVNAVVDGCRAKGHQVEIGGSLFSDAMGSFGTFEGTYIGMVSHNANTISDALK